MRSKLLLINPSIRESSPPKHVPLGALYVLTCAKEWYGADVALFDANALRDVAKQPEIDSDLAATVQEENWTCIGVGGITTTYSSIKHILKLVRPLTDSLIVLGGGGFTAQPIEWLNLLPQADIGVFSEALKTIGDVLEHAHDQDFHAVRGVFYRDGEKIKTAGERQDFVSMDELPLPMYELAPLDIYFKNSAILMSEESMTAKRRLDAISSIGCSLSCTFCYDLGLTGMRWEQSTEEMRFPRSHPKTISRVNRWASPEKCVHDWKIMRERYRCDFISLLDENIATMEAVHPSHNWIERISQLCVKEGLQPECVKDGVPHDPEHCSGLHFGSTSHSALIRPQTLRAMKAMGYCVAEGTDVACNPKATAVQVITTGTKVLSSSRQYRRVEAVATRKYEGNVLNIRPVGALTSRVTPEHQVLVVRDSQFEKFRDKNKGAPNFWRRAETRNRATIDDAIWVKAKDLKPNDFVIYPIPNLTRMLPIMDWRLAGLIGYYLAEGWTTLKSDGALFNQMAFEFGFDEMHLALDVRKRLQLSFGIKSQIRRRGSTISVRSGAFHVVKWFSQFGSNSYNKSIPMESLSHFDEKALRELIKCYWLGDGHVDAVGFGFTTVSKALAYQVKDILLMLGIIPRIYAPKLRKLNRIANNGVKSISQSYVVKVSAHRSPEICELMEHKHAALSRKRSVEYSFIRNGWFFSPIRSITEQSYAGNVYDLQVEADSTFALSNNILVHNSYLDYGLEAADDRILKHIRKGATLKTNVRGVIMTMRHGIRPIPNQLTGEETEDFESIRRMVVFWETMGIICFPFLYTPYPGSDIWYRNKERIMEQFGGDIDLFITTLNDATEPVVSISKNFTLEEILLYRYHMVRLDHEAIDRFENVWRKKHGLLERAKEEQTSDWLRFRSEVQRYADEAWAEKYDEIPPTPIAYSHDSPLAKS